ncbi:MAG: AraC family transcriptional regulator ligand-binding domain-containing protein [Pseudomonadota bacterium]
MHDRTAMAENRTYRATMGDTRKRDGGAGTIHLTLASTIVAYALSRGMKHHEIETVTGFDVSQLGNPEIRVPDDLVGLIWNELVRMFPHVPVTLEAAKGAPFSLLGGLAHGMQYAATLRDAFEFSRRNVTVLADRLELQVVETPTEVRVISTHPRDKLDDGCMAEMGTCVLARFVREVLGLKDALLRVDLTHAARGPHYDYDANFLCPVRFSADANALVLRPDMLEAPVRMAEPTLFVFIENHFELLRRQIDATRSAGDLSTLRRAIADAAAATTYSVGAILDRTGMSRRSAQRLAQLHGTTLAALIDETRKTNAEAFLSDRSVSIEMAASLLGYSDDRAFRRAFKRWTGQSPTDFRKLRSL